MKNRWICREKKQNQGCSIRNYSSKSIWNLHSSILFC